MSANGSHSIWLLAGASAGLALAFFGMLARAPDSGMPRDAAALVNGTIISNEAYRDALTRFGLDSRGALSPEDSRWVLERLIDEELLLQQALELGLVRDDTALRNLAVSTMIERIVTEAAAQPAGDEELRQWFADNKGLFRTQRRYRVIAWQGRVGSSAESANLEALDTDPALTRLPVPNARLPATKLVDYLGPAVIDAIAEATPGTVVSLDGYNGQPLTVLIVETVSGDEIRFDERRDEIETAWRRQRRDLHLRDYLERLRRYADLTIAGDS